MKTKFLKIKTGENYYLFYRTELNMATIFQNKLYNK